MNYSYRTNQRAFNQLTRKMTKQTIRARPDYTSAFILVIDVFKVGMGAILAQEDTVGKIKMIFAFSKNHDNHQKTIRLRQGTFSGNKKHRLLSPPSFGKRIHLKNRP